MSPTTRARSVPMGPLLAVLAAGACFLGALGWRLQMQSLEAQVRTTREGLKKLVLSPGVAPDRALLQYLTQRQALFEQRYRDALEALSPPAVSAAALADPQLFFQQQMHEMTQALERLAAARSMTVPQTLGFPKELPPPEVVPRLLTQLQLLQEAATLAVDQGVATLVSLKIDDPQPVRPSGEEAVLLTRLPVRVRFTATLPQLMKILGAVDRVAPMIDLREVRIAAAGDEDLLDIDCVLARYQLSPPVPEKLPEPERPARVRRPRPGA